MANFIVVSRLIREDFSENTESHPSQQTDPAHGAEAAGQFLLMPGAGRQEPGEGVEDTHQGGESEDGEGLLRVRVSGEV